MILTMDAKRRLTVPAGLSAAQPGDAFEVTIDADDDAIVFRRINRDRTGWRFWSSAPFPWTTCRRGVENISARNYELVA
jgi:bifunctional DNA-binding transcriptional regulator/antitoxin component of YhaV-PrlF toxin-antitoxin module